MESQKTAPAPPSLAYRVCKTILNRHQYYLDKTTPYTTVRWLFGVALFLFYTIRVYLLQGWYIVTYALGIYLLHLFVAFITPNTAGYGDTGDGNDGPSLPTTDSEEFRPFMRRLPEFKFWYSFSKAMVVAIICTYFDCINIPVFWPILVMYFVLLFTLTMMKLIKERKVEKRKIYATAKLAQGMSESTGLDVLGKTRQSASQEALNKPTQYGAFDDRITHEYEPQQQDQGGEPLQDFEQLPNGDGPGHQVNRGHGQPSNEV